MLNQLLLSNIYFAVYIFSALSFFAAGWIHLDSWKINKKDLSYLARGLGLFAVSVSLLVSSSQDTNWIFTYLQNTLKIYGGLMIFLSLITSPLLKKPKTQSLIAFSMPSISSVSTYLVFISPIIFTLTAIAFLIRMTKGLEKQLRGAFIAFSLFSFAEMLRILFIWSGSSVVYVNNLLSKYGPITIVILAIQTLSAFVLFRWVWGYVRFRASVQLFLTTLTFTLLVFLLTTATFTFLLMKNVENNLLESYEANAKVVQYSLEKLQFEAMANAKAMSTNRELIGYLEKNKKEDIFSLVNFFMLDQGLSFMNITDISGKVIVAGEDKDLANISLSEDPVAQSAVKGNPLATIYAKEGAFSPIIEVKASSPITSSSSKDTIGVAVTGFLVDNAFLDGIKDTTGMEITVYGKDVRSASTIFSGQDQTRLIGVEQTNQKILNNVLKDGQVWKGGEKIMNRPYLSVYVPLKSHGGDIIGMISVGKPLSILGNTAQKSVQSTFLVSAILMMISIVPAYFISKYIEGNITA